VISKISSTFINSPGVVKIDKSLDFISNRLLTPPNRIGDLLLGVARKPQIKDALFALIFGVSE
jgi:hypothetical protein